MTIPKIFQKDELVLRKKAVEVRIEKIGSPEIQKILKDMIDALATQDDGVAIAAPQIGVSLRIFVASKAVLDMPDAITDRAKMINRKELKQEAGYLTFINPVITKLSKDKTLLEEGCLSVRPLYGKIKRSKKASVKAYDENGRLFERGATGLLAQIFQHEVDHLNGILFIDNATDLKELPRETGNN